MNIRVRYAPSPTGKQHIGGVRTALFNYFFARAQQGTFILRIEDTDQERFQEDALQDIYDTFSWLGISWDEGPDKGGSFGPYFQSQRKELYQKYVMELIEKEAAYYCYCTQERLEDLRAEQQKAKKSATGYDRHCRDLTEAQRQEYDEKGISKVVRLKIPLDGETHFYDELLGDITRKNIDINPDPVILKSDGFPTYHLANVVDDHCMEITHILRAQEWIPSVPLHVIMYKAFGWTPPKFCHLPMVMGNDGHKLSKRHGSTSLVDFRKNGYLPGALINYISLLGWSYDDTREFFSVDEFEKLFTLKKLNKAPAVFDYKKLEWFNGQYIRKKTPEELTSLILPYLIKDNVIHDPQTDKEKEILKGIIPLIQERLRLLTDVSDLVRFLFIDVGIPDSRMLIPKRLDKEKTLIVLQSYKEVLSTFIASTDEENETKFREKALELDVKLGDFLAPLRIALTGTNVSPPLFESIRLLGVESTLRRVDQAISLLEKE
ncbi:MAG: glutamate--tRNA ligase [Spirochaetales bacterium]|nr:glutamate--tRNA ligase [Spirochaetales bacterium]